MTREESKNIGAMMEITEVLKNNPENACKFLRENADRFTKEGLLNILTEVFKSIDHNVNRGAVDGRLTAIYRDIFEDVQVELDEKYDDAYCQYASELKNEVEEER